ncbi:hypothetical protein BN136_2495 [Cronobacter universalis NCTC 9529]|nr:hypothetical protein BN136_2495 [Cronobacter universalis NCTC 9529]
MIPSCGEKKRRVKSGISSRINHHFAVTLLNIEYLNGMQQV